MRARPTARWTVRGIAAAVSALVGVATLAPLPASATVYQATNVSVAENSPPSGYNWCNAGFALASDNNTVDGGLESNIGNDEGELTFNFDLPANINSGSITISAPLGPKPASVPNNAPWGTTFPTTLSYQDDAVASNYGCTLASGHHFQIYNYGIQATFPSGDTDPGEYLYVYGGNITPSPAGNQVTIDFSFDGGDSASHLTVFIADVINPVAGTYNGVQYSVLAHDNNGNEYSSVAAPAQNSLTYVSTTPSATASTLTESIPNGASSISATENPASGATITATIYDAFYNPISGQPIYIGPESGSGETEPVSFGTGNGEPVTDSTGQASYYAWGTVATPPGDPDTFFGQDTGSSHFFIEDSHGNEATVSLAITAATPSPPSSGNNYVSSISVFPSGATQQSTSITVDQSATIDISLVDQFNNPEVDNAITLEPILTGSASASVNDFKEVGVSADDPAGSAAWATCDVGPASEVPGVSCTNSSGFTSFTITDTKAQEVTFEITDATDGYTLPYTDAPPTDAPNIPDITFTAGPTSGTDSTVDVDGAQSETLLADGIDTGHINVGLRDDHGNPEVGHAVEVFETSGVLTSLEDVAGVTDANGNISFPVNSTNLGTAYFEACDQTDLVCFTNANQLVSITFVTGAISASNSTVAVTPSEAVGDGQGQSTVTVTVRDEGNHPLAGEPVGLDTSSYPALAVVPPAVTTNAAGQATFVVRSTTPESVSIPVDVGRVTPVVLSTDADIDFTPAPTITSVVAQPTGPTDAHGNPEATGSNDVNITVSLADHTDTPISGLTVELITGTATSGPTLTTDGSGDAVFPVGLSASAPDLTVTYAALDVSDNYRVIGSVTVTYVPIPDEAHESTVMPPTQAIYTYEAGQPAGSQTAVINVVLRDASGNPLSDHIVNLVAGGSAVVTPVALGVVYPAGTTDASGHAQFDVTDPAVETLTVTVTDTTSSTTLAQSATVHVVLRPDEDTTSTIVAAPTLVSADGSSASVVTVTLMNHGAPLGGNTVSLSEGSSGHAVISTDDPVSNSAGQVRFYVRDLTSEQVALQATDLTTATLLTHDAVVTFAPPAGGTIRPSVTAISPTSGSGSGGSVVTITGANLSGATAVDFGTQPASTYSANAAGTQIIAVSPVPLAAGAVDVTVSGPGGTSVTSTADIYTYATGPALSVLAVSPDFVSVGSTTSVTISGTGLINAHSVHFGAVAATFTVSNGGETLTATVPTSAAPGIVNVTVSSVLTTSVTSTMDRFTYVGSSTSGPPRAPNLVRVSPRSGPLTGGTRVTVTGTGFTHVKSVRFGTRSAKVVSVNSAGTTLIVISPASTKAGAIAIVVHTLGGVTSSATADHFTYLAKKPHSTQHLVRAGRTARTREGASS